jgi:hypothetical protein
MTPHVDIIQAIQDPNIIGDSVSDTQEAALRALYGLHMTEGQVELARGCAGAAWRPGEEYREAAFICGRRSGKSDKLAANVAIYEAFFRDHQLSRGEKGIVLLLAQNMRQASVVKSYIQGKIEQSPILRQYVTGTKAHELELENRVTIAIHPASFRSIRGLSVVCCICDEIAFWWTEDSYANPDTEVIKAVRPAMATAPHGKLLLVSSPYTMGGVLWDAWRKRDEDEDCLVWRATTREMNPTVPERFLAREQARDPENYRREYLAEFTEAVSSFLSADDIHACAVPGRTELTPDLERHRYVATIDAAFKGDRFTMCVAHRDRDRGVVVIDHLTGWQGSRAEPLRLSQVMPRIATICERYGVRTVLGDQFGAEPLKDAFARHQLWYEERTFTNASKADIYGTLRSSITDCRLELLDHEDSLKELRGLELEYLPGGSIRVGHAGGSRAHDDYADAIALAVSESATFVEACMVGDDDDEPDDKLLLGNYDRYFFDSILGGDSG